MDICKFLVLSFLYCLARSGDDFCERKSLLKECQFYIPKKTAVQISASLYNGISYLHCYDKILKFNWPSGVYCNHIHLCGLGLVDADDLKRLVRYDKQLIQETSCKLLIDSSRHSCDKMKRNLKGVDKFPGKSEN